MRPKLSRLLLLMTLGLSGISSANESVIFVSQVSEGCFQNQIKYDQDLVHTTGSIREYCRCSAKRTAERLSEEDFRKLASGNVPRHFPNLMQESAASCSDLLKEK
jgi:hypothetical protein